MENQQILALESNKKIQKLENQLEEERQLNYSFDRHVNDKKNVNTQEATFTETSKNFKQKQENQTTEEDIENKEIPEEKKNGNLKEYKVSEDNKLSEEIKKDSDDKIRQPPKKGFWGRLFGN